MRNKIYVVTQARLASALATVHAELRQVGLWSPQLARVPVRLSRLHPYALNAYGWKCSGHQGPIVIPRISVPRLLHYPGWHSYVSLRDVLRHEYAHALADCFPSLVRSRWFVRTFGGSYSNKQGPYAYDPEIHVTEYAATRPAEDFAETFMVWLRSGNSRPPVTGWLSPKFRLLDRVSAFKMVSTKKVAKSCSVRLFSAVSSH